MKAKTSDIPTEHKYVQYVVKQLDFVSKKTDDPLLYYSM